MILQNIEQRYDIKILLFASHITLKNIIFKSYGSIVDLLEQCVLNLVLELLICVNFKNEDV
jgi:hypothetical protein